MQSLHRPGRTVHEHIRPLNIYKKYESKCSPNIRNILSDKIPDLETSRTTHQWSRAEDPQMSCHEQTAEFFEWPRLSPDQKSSDIFCLVPRMVRVSVTNSACVDARYFLFFQLKESALTQGSPFIARILLTFVTKNRCLRIEKFI